MTQRFTEETDEVIHARMLADIRDDVDKRQGSVVYDLTAPAAAELAQAYMALDDVLTFGFASEDMPSEYLDLRTAELGVFRRPSVKAYGTLTYTGDDGTEIPKGTRSRTENNVYFTTTETAIITDGVATVSAEAEEGGAVGNVALGEITVTLGDLTGVTGVTNESSFNGGIDTESDASLLSRYYERVQKPATSGNANHYVQWAKEVPGVGEARVFPLWDGAGTVKVVIVDDRKRPASPEIVNQVYGYIEEVRPIGAEVTVESSPGKEIKVSVSIRLAEGAVLSNVLTDFEQSITEYLESIAFIENYVSYARVGSLLLGTPGVLDYEDLLVNDITTNIALALDEAPFLDSVDMDVIT